MTIEQTQIELIHQAHHHLGKAMFAAAALERALVNAAADHRLASARAEGCELGADPWEKAASEGMDKNLKRLSPLLKGVDGLEDRLTAAKGRRNHLAHDFCFEAAPLLLAPEPALRVIAELDADESTFLDLADEVAAISRAILEEAGIDRALADAVGAALIEQAKAQ